MVNTTRSAGREQVERGGERSRRRMGPTHRAGGYESGRVVAAQAREQVARRGREISDQVVGVDTGPVAQARDAGALERVHADHPGDAGHGRELPDDAGSGFQIEHDGVGGGDSESGQGVHERLSRDLRRAALQELLDDVLVESGYRVQALVVVEMNDLLIRAWTAQDDVLALGFWRPNQTHNIRERHDGALSHTPWGVTTIAAMRGLRERLDRVSWSGQRDTCSSWSDGAT